MYQAHLKEAYFNRKQFANRKKAGAQFVQSGGDGFGEGPIKAAPDGSLTAKDKDHFLDFEATVNEKRFPSISGKKGQGGQGEIGSTLSTAKSKQAGKAKIQVDKGDGEEREGGGSYGKHAANTY